MEVVPRQTINLGGQVRMVARQVSAFSPMPLTALLAGAQRQALKGTEGVVEARGHQSQRLSAQGRPALLH